MNIETRKNFKKFIKIPTRWMDNDVYGHINNVVYYSYFDTAINTFLIQNKVLDYHAGNFIGLVVENSCTFFSSIKFPDELDIGIRVAHVGNSSVRYEIGIFVDSQFETSAIGYFVHVYVDRKNHKPIKIDKNFRSILEKIKKN